MAVSGVRSSCVTVSMIFWRAITSLFSLRTLAGYYWNPSGYFVFYFFLFVEPNIDDAENDEMQPAYLAVAGCGVCMMLPGTNAPARNGSS